MDTPKPSRDKYICIYIYLQADYISQPPTLPLAVLEIKKSIKHHRWRSGTECLVKLKQKLVSLNDTTTAALVA